MSLLSALFERQLVGLDIGVSSIKAVELNSGKGFRLVAYNRIPLPHAVLTPEGEVRDRDVLVKAVKRLFESKGFSTKRVAVGAFGNSIITKKITVPKMSHDELREQLYWEAEQYIPFPVNEINLDFAVLGPAPGTASGGPGLEVLLVAAKKEFVRNITSIVEDAGLKPSIVDGQAFALGNAYEFNYGGPESGSSQGVLAALIDFGAGSTKVSLVDGDKTTFTRELRQSGLACTQMIADALRLPWEEAEAAKISSHDKPAVIDVVREFTSTLVEEVGRTIEFCLSQNTDKSLGGVYICGGASKTEGLKEALENRLAVPVQGLNPVQSIPGSGRRMNAEAIRELGYLGGVAVGLALRTLGDDQ